MGNCVSHKHETIKRLKVDIPRYPSLQGDTAPKLQGKWKGKEKAPIPKSAAWDLPKKTVEAKCPLCGDMIPSKDKV